MTFLSRIPPGILSKKKIDDNNPWKSFGEILGRISERSSGAIHGHIPGESLLDC